MEGIRKDCGEEELMTTGLAAAMLFMRARKHRGCEVDKYSVRDSQVYPVLPVMWCAKAQLCVVSTLEDVLDFSGGLGVLRVCGALLVTPISQPRFGCFETLFAI